MSGIDEAVILTPERIAEIAGRAEKAIGDDMPAAVQTLRNAIPENPTAHFGLTHALNALIRHRAAVSDIPALLASHAALAEAWVEAKSAASFAAGSRSANPSLDPDGRILEMAIDELRAARAAFHAALAAHRAEVREVTGPFANVAIVYEDLPDEARIGAGPNGNDITAGDLRRAAALHEKMEG